ncbi:hypothetical protein IMY05_018G0044600 [Salix suchowensis]|nr:hypothetical protein IMY05_018G0044600 [Salix suchowensis]
MCNKLIRWYFSYESETRKACNGGGGKDPGNVDSLMKGNLWNQQSISNCLLPLVPCLLKVSEWGKMSLCDAERRLRAVHSGI